MVNCRKGKKKKKKREKGELHAVPFFKSLHFLTPLLLSDGLLSSPLLSSSSSVSPGAAGDRAAHLRYSIRVPPLNFRPFVAPRGSRGLTRPLSSPPARSVASVFRVFGRLRRWGGPWSGRNHGTFPPAFPLSVFVWPGGVGEGEEMGENRRAGRAEGRGGESPETDRAVVPMIVSHWRYPFRICCVDSLFSFLCRRCSCGVWLFRFLERI